MRFQRMSTRKPWKREDTIERASNGSVTEPLGAIDRGMRQRLVLLWINFKACRFDYLARVWKINASVQCVPQHAMICINLGPLGDTCYCIWMWISVRRCLADGRVRNTAGSREAGSGTIVSNLIRDLIAMAYPDLIHFSGPPAAFL